MERRHLTTAATMLVLLGILGLGLVVGVKSLFAPIEKSTAASASPSPSCAATRLKKGQQIRATQVQVSVFNAGTHSGLADRTLAALGRRGFKQAGASNAPGNVTVRRVQVWTTKKHDPAARLVARQFGRRTTVKVTKQDLGPGIDVVVGNRFHGLKRTAPTKLTVRKPQKVCLPAPA